MDDPPVIAIGLDLWSQHHNGYMGLNGHYLSRDWKRVIFNMACVPFNESHTAEHIHERLVLEIVSWNIVMKAGPCLRDNAANVVAAFKVCFKFYLNFVLCLVRCWLSHKIVFRLSQRSVDQVE